MWVFGNRILLKCMFSTYIGFCASNTTENDDSDCPTRKFFQNFFYKNNAVTKLFHKNYLRIFI